MYAVSNEYISLGAVQSERISGISVRPLSAVEAGFVENWAGLARGFGMGAEAGRVHAVLFLAEVPMTACEVAAQAGLDELRATECLGRLVAYGSIERTANDAGVPAYLSVSDPWAWFSSTVRERARREFAPLLKSIRSLQACAEAAHGEGRLSKARLSRITRFSRFVDQVAKLVETFGNAGSSRPMMSAARTMARFICG